MNGFVKVLILIGVALYVVSPIDLLPGPIDDAIVILLGLASRKRVAEKA
ncbi:MAG: hypothetical protein PUC73_07030 [Lachnospiraceae bacterium]|nr:hypothetical protein [Lachnospiraceae bacterium]